MVYSVAQTVCCGEDEPAVVGVQPRSDATPTTCDGPVSGARRTGSSTGSGGSPSLGASRVYLQVLDLDDLDHLALLSDQVLPQVG